MNKRSANVLTIMLCGIIITVSIIIKVFNIQLIKQNEWKSPVNESFDDKSERLNAKAAGSENVDSTNEVISEFEPEAQIIFYNTEKIESLLPLKGHSHLVKDTQSYLIEQGMDSVREIYVIKNGTKFENGVTTIKCRMDLGTGILMIIYAEQSDTFQFELEQ